MNARSFCTATTGPRVRTRTLATVAWAAGYLLLMSTIGRADPGNLPAPEPEGPPPARVPDAGRTIVLLGIGVVAASWAHRNTTLHRR